MAKLIKKELLIDKELDGIVGGKRKLGNFLDNVSDRFPKSFLDDLIDVQEGGCGAVKAAKKVTVVKKAKEIAV